MNWKTQPEARTTAVLVCVSTVVCAWWDQTKSWAANKVWSLRGYCPTCALPIEKTLKSGSEIVMEEQLDLQIPERVTFLPSKRLFRKRTFDNLPARVNAKQFGWMVLSKLSAEHHASLGLQISDIYILSNDVVSDVSCSSRATSPCTGERDKIRIVRIFEARFVSWVCEQICDHFAEAQSTRPFFRILCWMERCPILPAVCVHGSSQKRVVKPLFCGQLDLS